jgi:hypothetical protein
LADQGKGEVEVVRSSCATAGSKNPEFSFFNFLEISKTHLGCRKARLSGQARGRKGMTTRNAYFVRLAASLEMGKIGFPIKPR